MIHPCEYCGRPVVNAERWLRHGVLPCCRECKRIPLALAFCIFGMVSIVIVAAIAQALR